MFRQTMRAAAWLTAGTASLLLAASAVAQSAEDYDRYSKEEELLEKQDHRVENLRSGSPTTSFGELDTDEDGVVDWEDIAAEHRDKLQEAGWDRDAVMEQFDTDGDQELNEKEYDSFQTALFAQTSDAVARGAQQTGPQEIDVTLLPMSVKEITDAEVINSRGEEIGSVRSVVRDDASGKLSLVVESGGVLGLGANSILVDLAEVSQMSDNQLLWDTMLSRDDIAEIPEFDDSHYTEVSELDSTLTELQEGG